METESSVPGCSYSTYMLYNTKNIICLLFFLSVVAQNNNRDKASVEVYQFSP